MCLRLHSEAHYYGNEGASRMSRPLYDYTVYGLHVCSPFALPFTPLPGRRVIP